MQEKPLRHFWLHQFILYPAYINCFLNHNFNHHPEEKEKRETELESEKMFNILFFKKKICKESLIKGIRKESFCYEADSPKSVRFQVAADEFKLKRDNQRIQPMSSKGEVT